MNIKPRHLLTTLVLGAALLLSLDTLPGYAAPPVRPVSLDDTRNHATTSANRLAQPSGTRIIVKKVMEGGSASFTFTGHVSGSITTHNGELQQDVTPGTYTSTEAALAGWDLVNIQCNDDNSTGDVATRTATFRVTAGEMVTCTFTNRKRATIKVKKVMEGDIGSFTFTGQPSGVISTNNGELEASVAPGQYQVTETAPTGWDLTGISCDDGSSGNLATRTATFDVEAGETVTCTFTNRKRATIKVKKVMEGDIGSFTFTGQPSGVISTNNGELEASVPPGQYQVTETAPTGWDLTGISCDNANSSGDVPSRTATFNVVAGQEVTCTFTNTKRATIKVKKVMIGDTGSFTFSGSPNGSINSNNGTIQASVPPGTYTSTEAALAGWDLTSIVCDDDASSGNLATRTATFDVEAGETVTCTFTNRKRATIKVKKVMIGGTGSFTFTGPPSGVISTNNGELETNVPPGQYQVTETVPTGWDLTGISCNHVNSTGDLTTQTATFNVVAGQEVTCTFTNTRRGTLIVQKSASPADTGLVFTFERSFGDNFTLSAGGSRTFLLRPGSHTIGEVVPTGWLLSTSCSNGVNTNPATIALASGQTVSCTFANSAQATSIQLIKTASPTSVEPGGGVEYRYEVRNTSLALLPLTDVVLEDNHCVPGNLTGDTNNSGALDIGETWVYTCSTEVIVDTANTATVTARDFLNRTVSDTASAFVDVRPTVAISKAVTPVARPQPGGLFAFTLTITNTSSEPVRITELSDSYPLSAECQALEETVLAVEEAVTCNYSVTRTQPGTYTNMATVTVREEQRSHPLDPADLTATASANASFTVGNLPSSLTVTRWAQPNALAAPGGPVTFTLFVTNTSPVDSVTLTTISEDRDNDGVVDDTFAAGAICATTTLAPGAATTCLFSYEITGAAGAAITGKTTVNAIDDDNDNVSATATAPVYLLDGAPLAVTKTPRANSITEPGGSVVFDVTVRNHHPVSAMRLTGLDDSVFGDITATAQNGANATDCALVTVPAAGVYSCSFSALVSGEAGDLHTNTLTATGRAGDGVIYTGQGSAQVTIGAAPAPLTVTKRDTLVTDRNLNGQVNPSDEIEYEITVTNSGKQPGAGLTLEDTPDANTALVTGSVTASGGAQVVTGNNPGDTRVKVTLPAPLAVGASFVVTFRVQIKEPLPPNVITVSNQALVTGDNILPTLSDDPDTPAPGDPTVTPVLGLPNVLLSKSDTLLIDADEDGFPSPGDTLLYELVVNNRGGQVATEIELTDILDENTTLVVGSVQASQGEVRQGNTPGDTSVRIAVGNLDPDAAATFSFQVVIADPLPPGVVTVSNQARVTGGNFAPMLSDDPSTDARNDPTVTAVTAAPLLVVSKRDFLYEDADGDDQAGPGDTIFYLIRVHNMGNTSAVNLLLSDTPDGQTTLIAGNVQTTQGQVLSGNSTGDRMVQVGLGDIPPGATANIGFRVRINASASEPLVNQAAVQFINPNDATRTVVTLLSDDPDTAPGGDPTVTPIKPAQPGGGLIDLLLPFVFR